LEKGRRKKRKAKRRRANQMSFTRRELLGLNIIFLNICSLVHKLETLEFFLDSLKLRVDVLVLNETWLLPGEEINYNLNGFISHHQPRDSRNSKGGGVAIYTASHLNHGMMFGEIIDEVHFLGVTLLDFNIHFFTFYRPPTNQNFEFFLT
jgi:hypothetical protein